MHAIFNRLDLYGMLFQLTGAPVGKISCASVLPIG
jgi:hypothetical protein